MLFSLMLNVISMAFILQIYSVFCCFPNFLEFFFCYAHDFSYLCRIICVVVCTMERKEFESYMQKYADQIEAIRQSAHKLHQSVNQTYGDQLPYGFHLDMVVQAFAISVIWCVSAKPMCCPCSSVAITTTASRTLVSPTTM